MSSLGSTGKILMSDYGCAPDGKTWREALFEEAARRGEAEAERDAARAQMLQLIEAAAPFSDHDWYDAELEDDNCKLTRHSGPVTVGHWRALGKAVNAARASTEVATCPKCKRTRGDWDCAEDECPMAASTSAVVAKDSAS